MAGLGANFNKLWAASTVSNIGDGIAAAAAPLLVASVTDDPVLVGLAVFVQKLPWLAFSLLSGVFVDRLDRQRLIVVVNVIRAVVIGALTVAVWQGMASIPVIYAAGFLLGTCETLGDNASATLLPAIVRSEDLPRANSRMATVFFAVNQFAAPPLGAALFVVAAALPFGINALTFGLAGLLISTLRIPHRPPAPSTLAANNHLDATDPRASASGTPAANDPDTQASRPPVSRTDPLVPVTPIPTVTPSATPEPTLSAATVASGSGSTTASGTSEPTPSGHDAQATFPAPPGALTAPATPAARVPATTDPGALGRPDTTNPATQVPATTNPGAPARPNTTNPATHVAATTGRGALAVADATDSDAPCAANPSGAGDANPAVPSAPLADTAAHCGGGWRSIRADMGEGVRWLLGNSALRTLAVSLLMMNTTLMAGFSIFVLYSRDRLGLNEYGYGVLLTAMAVGSLIGAAVAPRLQARFSDSLLLRTGLVIETLTHLGLALAPTVWVVGPVLIAFGLHNSIWGAVCVTLRQRTVPDALRGRVQSVYMMFVVGGSALGGLIGGSIARWLGITGPFWLSAAAMAVLTACAWRTFGRRLTAQGPVHPATQTTPHHTTTHPPPQVDPVRASAVRRTTPRPARATRTR